MNNISTRFSETRKETCFRVHFLCSDTICWWSLGYTSNKNHVIITELNTNPNGLLRSSISGAMFGVASTTEIGTTTLKNMNIQLAGE